MIKIRNPDEQLLTRAQVAEIFHVSPSTITRWAEAGKLPMVKTLGGHRRYETRVVMELARQIIQEEVVMKKAVIPTPAMYADHHVIEVRRILLQLPGVEDVNASSCFHLVEVTYDPTRLAEEDLKAKLAETGYLGDTTLPTESGLAITQEDKRNGQGFFRHTTAHEQTKQVISFAQEVSSAGRPLWPCPGLGVIKPEDLKEVSHA
jgi:excisionase family DNA binding protein